MPLSFLAPRCEDPDLRLLRVGLVIARPRRRPPARRDWLRISRRLAGGLTPAQAARAEGAEVGDIDALLAQEGFRRLIDAQVALEAMAPAEQTARLVRLARIALENALGDLDVGAACFVLHENAQGRDPAVTIAQRIVAERPRSAPKTAPAPPARIDGDPLAGVIRRSTAALRRATVEEYAVHHAAVATTRTTADAARAALAAKQAAPTASLPAERRSPAASPALGALPSSVPRRHRVPHRPRAP